MRGTITRVETAEPVIALTFDDGPDPAVTPALLDVLDRYEARATFFMVGQAAAGHRSIIDAVAGSGHEIANHSWSHRPLPPLRWRERFREIDGCARALAPHGTRLLRPPFGRQSRGSYLAARLRGYAVVAWSLSVQDWLVDDADAIAYHVLARARRGDIVLLHDGSFGRSAERRSARTAIVSAVATILERLEGRLTSVTVSTLLDLGTATCRRWMWNGSHADSTGE